MPTTHEHLARAKQNFEFANSFDLDTTPYLDWVATAYFYAALHLVDALIWHIENADPEDHSARHTYLRKWYLSGISTEYRSLKHLSEDARYRLFTFSKPKVLEKIVPLYNEIQRHVMQMLEQEAGSKPAKVDPAT
ncbi:MAG TPA: hypothetical protein VGG15_03215 [Terriglobales bacterium]